MKRACRNPDPGFLVILEMEINMSDIIYLSVSDVFVLGALIAMVAGTFWLAAAEQARN